MKRLMRENNLQISRVSELHLLRNNKRYHKIELHLASLSRRGNKIWTNKLNKSYHEEGNDMARYFAISSLIVGFITLLTFFIYQETIPLQHFSMLFIAVILMGGLGKFIGKMIAAIQLRKMIITIQSQTNNQRLSNTP
jgi:K+-sensing histidine kinase KdpD